MFTFFDKLSIKPKFFSAFNFYVKDRGEASEAFLSFIFVEDAFTTLETVLAFEIV